MRLLIASLIFCVTPLLVAAQNAPLLSMESRDSGRPWEAVGRLELGSDSFCTGSLIAPALVLTAAHCLFREDGTMLSAQEIQFLAGWRNGRAATYRRVRRAVPHPHFNYLGEANPERVYNDLALIELQHPVRNASIIPFEFGRVPTVGEPVGVVSYAHNRSEAPSLQDGCRVLAHQDAILILSCSVDFGSSGSPVFRVTNNTAKIVSVVSSKARSGDVSVSLATPLEDQVATIANAMRNGAGFAQGSIFRRLKAGDTTRKSTGAKFVRPLGF